MLAFWLAATVPGLDLSTASALAIGGSHSELVAVPSVHATVSSVSVARKVAPPATSIMPYVAAQSTAAIGSVPASVSEHGVPGADERESHAFTYDATAPPKATR
ncbi:MAG: hypothetical protein ABI205_05420 [Gemmatimonadaceae bacterium]